MVSFPAFLSPAPLAGLPAPRPSLSRGPPPRRPGGAAPGAPRRGARMTNDWPATSGPMVELYSTRFPPWRLNRAPVITVNALGSEAASGIGVALRELRADEGEGEALRARARALIADAAAGGGAPGGAVPEVVRRWYTARGRAVNVAPVVSVCGSSVDGGRSVYVGMGEVAACMARGKQVLEEAVARGPAGFWVREMAGQVAPFIKAVPEQGVVLENAKVPLDMVGAKMILDQYRR